MVAAADWAPPLHPQEIPPIRSRSQTQSRNSNKSLTAGWEGQTAFPFAAFRFSGLLLWGPANRRLLELASSVGSTKIGGIMDRKSSLVLLLVLISAVPSNAHDNKKNKDVEKGILEKM